MKIFISNSEIFQKRTDFVTVLQMKIENVCLCYVLNVFVMGIRKSKVDKV